MAEWMDGNILETEFISHSGPNAYEIHFRTPERTKYLFVESACREAISRDIHRCSECTNILQLRGHFECKIFDTIFFTDKLVSCEYFSKANADRKAEGGGGEYYPTYLDFPKPKKPPQDRPLCDTCKHAIDGVVDDFATVFCSVRQGYFGQVTECKDYKDKRGGGEDG